MFLFLALLSAPFYFDVFLTIIKLLPIELVLLIIWILIMGIIELIAIPGLYKNKSKSWKLLFYLVLIMYVGPWIIFVVFSFNSLLIFPIFQLIVCLLVSIISFLICLYVLFQLRPLYNDINTDTSTGTATPVNVNQDLIKQ